MSSLTRFLFLYSFFNYLTFIGCARFDQLRPNNPQLSFSLISNYQRDRVVEITQKNTEETLRTMAWRGSQERILVVSTARTKISVTSEILSESVQTSLKIFVHALRTDAD